MLLAQKSTKFITQLSLLEIQINEKLSGRRNSNGGTPMQHSGCCSLIASSEAIKALGLRLGQEWVQTEPFVLRHMGIVTLSVMEPNVPPG